MSSETNRIGLLENKGFVSLDLLRGAAAFAVAVPHYFLFQGATSAPLEFISIMAVEVFFVLSGFVLARQLILCVESQSLLNLGVFYSRRWMRTLPPYGILLIFISLVSDRLFTADFWQYSVFIRNFFSVSGEGDYYPPAWSLAVEEWFYILFPVFLIVLSRLRVPRIGIVIAFGVALLALKLIYAIQFSDLFADGRRIAVLRLDAIGLGFALALLDVNRLAQQRGILPLLFFAALTFLGASIYAFSRNLVFLFCYAAPLFSAALLYLVLLLERHVAAKRGLRGIAALGANISYTAYLAHMLVVLLLAGLRDVMPPGLHFALYIVALVGFCVLFFIAVEAPILRRRPSYTRVGQQPGPTPAPPPVSAQPGLGYLRPGLLISSNILVALALCFAVEVGAWTTKRLYIALRNADILNMARMDSATAPIDTEGSTSVYSSPGVLRDLENNKNMPGGAYRYENYLIFQNRPFASEHVNIAEDGRRLNGNGWIGDAEIWMFGSSPVFGATNGDRETMASYLEDELNAARGGARLRVFNYGVAGYTSWQDLMHFQFRLSRQPKPRLVLFFNGHNDYNLAWLSDPNCERLFETAVGSSRVLSESWELRSHGGYVIWPDVRATVLSYFSNTLELQRLVRKAVQLRAANADVENWRRGYLEQRRNTTATAEKCLRTEQEMFLRNMRLAAALAESEGIAIGFIHQPIIHTTRKPLTPYESSYLRTSVENSFSLSDAELAELKSVPSHRLDQAYVWDKSRYAAGYAAQKNSLMDLAAATGALLVDADAAIDRSDATVFSSSIHFTFHGTRLIAAEIAEQVMKAFPDKLAGARP